MVKEQAMKEAERVVEYIRKTVSDPWL